MPTAKQKALGRQGQPVVLVDSRVGSRHLLTPLDARLSKHGFEVQHATVKHGDVTWSGVREDGSTCKVAAELKNIADLVSSMTSKRLAGFQLPGMCQTSDVVYLIVEGLWRCGDDGVLEVHDRGQWVGFGSRRWGRRASGGHGVMWSQVVGFLASLQDVGIRVWQTAGKTATADVLAYLVRRWQRRGHKSLEAIYLGDRPMLEGGELVPLRRTTFARWFAAGLPGIGWAKSAAVVRVLPTTDDMHAAGRKEWAEIEWRDRNGKRRKLGPVIGARVWAQLRSEEHI